MLTKNAHAGVNVFRSCGLLYQIISIEKQTTTDSATYTLRYLSRFNSSSS